MHAIDLGLADLSMWFDVDRQGRQGHSWSVNADALSSKKGDG